MSICCITDCLMNLSCFLCNYICNMPWYDIGCSAIADMLCGAPCNMCCMGYITPEGAGETVVAAATKTIFSKIVNLI
jgi:hypothetical protein